jgi:protein involved in polysaccharide export with SLBB domain
VAIAGDLKESAKHSQVLLFHRTPDGWIQVRKVNLKRTLKEADLQEDVYLQPGDFLYVPKNTLSKIQRFIPTPTIGTYVPLR